MSETLGTIFDCDGTLLDSMDAWIGLQDAVAAKLGVTLTPEDESYLLSSTIPSMVEFFMKKLNIDPAHASESGIDINAMKDWAWEHMRTFYANNTVAKPGALDYVKMLHERGIQVCIASSTPSDCLAAGMQHCGFEPYITKIFSASDMHTTKVKPDLFLACADFMGLPPEQCWVFEDSAYAIMPAREVGFHVVGIDDHGPSSSRAELEACADFVIDDFPELNLSFPPTL